MLYLNKVSYSMQESWKCLVLLFSPSLSSKEFSTKPFSLFFVNRYKICRSHLPSSALRDLFETDSHPYFLKLCSQVDRPHFKKPVFNLFHNVGYFACKPYFLSSLPVGSDSEFLLRNYSKSNLRRCKTPSTSLSCSALVLYIHFCLSKSGPGYCCFLLSVKDKTLPQVRGAHERLHLHKTPMKRIIATTFAIPSQLF